MAKLINAESVLEKLNDPVTNAFAKEIIFNEPDAIVRCGECIYWHGFKDSIYGYCDFNGPYRKTDWFCADGRNTYNRLFDDEEKME